MSLAVRAVHIRPLRAGTQSIRLLHASTSARATPTKLPKSAEAKKQKSASAAKSTTAESTPAVAPREQVVSLDGQALRPPAGRWKPESLRTGVIAFKRGMTANWDEHGAMFPVTVLQVRLFDIALRLSLIFYFSWKSVK